MRRASAASWVVGAGLWLVLAACTSGSGRHPVAEVVVQGETVENNALLGLGAPQVEAVFREAIDRHRRFQRLPETDAQARAKLKDGRAVSLVLEVPFTREAEKEGRAGRYAEVGVSVTIRRRVDLTTVRYEVVGLGEAAVADEADAQAAMRRALEQALKVTLDAADLQLRALTKKDEALVADLAGEEPVSGYALRVLTERGHPAAADALIERLRTEEDPEQVREAMGALAEMRDQRAVRPLIEATRGRDAAFVREVVFALAQIGGEEAMAYVFTVAQGHDDPQVRAAATQAMTELEARDGTDAPATSEGSTR